ncbi:MAG: DEAD/DEAH box helicase [Bdellovibrionia bacterium]
MFAQSSLDSSRPFELRPFQKEALEALREPGHLICIAPTGSGKSLIYETYARNHRVLLVTPLVALARQQHLKLTRLGIPVTLAAGPDPMPPPQAKTGVWIISPERLAHPLSSQKAAAWKPSLLAVDECHCLWDWGEKFRPSFLQIPKFLKEHSIPRSVWLSATLPKLAREELRHELPAPIREMGEFGLPPTLHLSVQRVPWPQRTQRLLEFVLTQKDAGILFVQTRATAERLSLLLKATGKRCAVYHAGMSSEERRIIENQIEEHQPEIVIATSAFGMGMDHPHLRWALLWQAPPSLLSLAQSIGRAGRHPHLKSRALIFWDEEDFRLLQWMTQGSARRLQELHDVQNFLIQSACRRASLRSYFCEHGASSLCDLCDFCTSLLDHESKL